MSHLINNEQKLTEIIFADRNKAYGAYVLRSEYGYTVFKSISMMLVGVASIASAALYISNKDQPDPDLSSGQIPIHDTIIVIPFGEEEEVKEKTEKPEKPEEPPKTDDKKITETESTIISETTTAVAETSTATPAVETGTAETIADTGTPTKGKIGNPLGTPDTNIVSQPFEVDSLPQFEGGLAALGRFVAQHLKYPTWAFNEGKEGTVFVKFVVDEHGKVGRLSLLNSPGYGMDEEALRVVGLIPKFKSPAKVKGMPVKAYYQMPIRFRFSKF